MGILSSPAIVSTALGVCAGPVVLGASSPATYVGVCPRLFAPKMQVHSVPGLGDALSAARGRDHDRSFKLQKVTLTL